MFLSWKKRKNRKEIGVCMFVHCLSLNVGRYCCSPNRQQHYMITNMEMVSFSLLSVWALSCLYDEVCKINSHTKDILTTLNTI